MRRRGKAHSANSRGIFLQKEAGIGALTGLSMLLHESAQGISILHIKNTSFILWLLRNFFIHCEEFRPAGFRKHTNGIERERI